MFYFPIIGALSNAIGVTLERIILRKRKAHIKTYLVAIFLGVVLVMLPFVYFFWDISSAAFELNNILIFLFIIFLSIIANLFFFYSLKWEKVSYTEPARILEPLFVIFLALIFSFFLGTELYDRNFNVIIPALIAGLAIIFSHVEKHHLALNKYFLSAIAASFVFALELVITRILLDFYSPISFYFIRAFSVFIITLLLFRPQFNKLSKKVRWEILAVAFFWVIFRVSVYYGYVHLGVIFTTLMVMLAPVFIYFFAWKFLKEKINYKHLSAAVIIVACVLYAILS